MLEQNQKLNFRYSFKMNEVTYNIQLFNILQQKIKIMVNTKNFYSDDYQEYSNTYTLIQFKEITKYYMIFENIDEIFEDLSRIIQEKKFSISHNGNTINLTIKVIIKQDPSCISFILDKDKTIDLSFQKDVPFSFNNFNNASSMSKNHEKSKNNQFYLYKSKRSIDISNIKELNTLLSDFKDRLTILETNQNQNNMNCYGNTDNMSLDLENILLRLNRLENENIKKEKKIEVLQKKLKFYESMRNNNTEKYLINNKNILNYSNHLLENKSSTRSLNNNFQFKTQKQNSISFIMKGNNKKNNKFKFSKSHNNNNHYYDNASLPSKDSKKYNHIRNTNNNKKLLYKENNKKNKSFGDKDSNKSDKINNSYSKDINNGYLRTNNSGLNSTMSNFSNFKDKNFKKYIYIKEKYGIPLIQREDLKKYINSRIIFTKTELKLLKTKLSGGEKKLHVFFDLLYRASIDGDYEEIIRENIINKEKMLTLFYTYEGSRFGVYIFQKMSASFLKGKKYKEVPGESFIVSLNNLKFFDISPNKTSKEGHDNFLSFGRTFYLNANGTNWLIYTPRSNFLKKRCIIGNQQGEYIDFEKEILIGNNNEYHIKDVEIFEVVFEREKKKKNIKNKHQIQNIFL